MRAALVGTGAIARQHLACLAGLAGAQLVAVCDLSRVSAEWAAERYGATAWYTDFHRMLAEARPDVVHVTTPVTSHHALAGAALEAGAHVLVEKPIVLDPGELDDLLARAAAVGRHVIEDYNYLFNPPMLALRELLASGELGEILHADTTFSLDILAPGSPFSDRDAPHPAVSLPGGPAGDFVTHVAALAHAVVGAHRRAHAVWSDGSRGDGLQTEMLGMIEAERGTASLRFSGRAHPSVLAVRVSATAGSATASISGRRLILEADLQWRRPVLSARRVLSGTVQAVRAAVASPVERLSGGPGLYVGIWNLIEATYAALRDDAPPPVSARQVREVNAMRAALIVADGAR